MVGQKKQELNTGLINRASGLIKDNAKMARDGMLYYLDTLGKLPGAYMASKDQIKAETLSRKRINGLEDIQLIRHRIEESKTKINSIGKWVNLAKDGSWNERVKKKIEYFDLSAGKLKRKTELLDLDYQYFVDSFLDCYKDELKTFFNGVDADKDGNSKKLEIVEGLTKVGLIGERAQDLAFEANKLEGNVESFIDNKLSGASFGEPKGARQKIAAPSRSPAKRLVLRLYYTSKRVNNAIKLVILGLYYVARMFIFVIKYFVLLPVAFTEKIIRLFRKKKIRK